MPSEFQLPTDDAENINTKMHNLEINDFTGNFLHIKYCLFVLNNNITKFIDSFNRRNHHDNDRNMFNIEDIFRLMELEFQNLQNHINESEISGSKYFTIFWSLI